jgi:hypothetical protein
MTGKRNSSCFKQTTIVPVPKNAKVTCLNDYRPIALTSVDVTPWSGSPVSTPSRCRLLSPVYISLCFLSVPVRLVCQVNQYFSLLLFFPVFICFWSSWFRPLPVLTLYPPAWPLCLFWPTAFLSPCTVLDSDLVSDPCLAWPRDCLSSGTVWSLTWFMNSRLSLTCLCLLPLL